ncbi:MAG: META domain-containing protein [Candidatus Altimarinota bacterium]
MSKNYFLNLSVFSLVTASLIITGCQPTTPTPPPNNNQNTITENTNNEEIVVTPELAGTSWEWIKTTKKDGSNIKAATSNAFILSFHEDARVSSSTDCNSLSGNYELTKDQLSFSPFVQTLMLCAESQETEYVIALSSGGKVTINGDMLIIASENYSMEFAKTEDPETLKESSTPDLAGTSWQWVKTSMNDESVTESAKPEAFILSFDQEGRMSSKTDCNSINSTYTANQGELIFGPLAMTKMFCEGSQESAYAKALGEVQSYLVNGETLSMALKMDSGIMEFTKVQ